MFALSNGPIRNVVWLHFLLSQFVFFFFWRGGISWVLKCHTLLGGKGTTAFKTGQHFWVPFPEAPMSFGPNGTWDKKRGGLHRADPLKQILFWVGQWVSGNQPCRMGTGPVCMLSDLSVVTSHIQNKASEVITTWMWGVQTTKGKQKTLCLFLLLSIIVYMHINIFLKEILVCRTVGKNNPFFLKKSSLLGK